MVPLTHRLCPDVCSGDGEGGLEKAYRYSVHTSAAPPALDSVLSVIRADCQMVLYLGLCRCLSTVGHIYKMGT